MANDPEQIGALEWAKRRGLGDTERLWIEEAGCETVADVIARVRAQKFMDWFGYPHSDEHRIRQALITDGFINDA